MNKTIIFASPCRAKIVALLYIEQGRVNGGATYIAYEINESRNAVNRAIKALSGAGIIMVDKDASEISLSIDKNASTPLFTPLPVSDIDIYDIDMCDIDMPEKVSPNNQTPTPNTSRTRTEHQTEHEPNTKPNTSRTRAEHNALPHAVRDNGNSNNNLGIHCEGHVTVLPEHEPNTSRTPNRTRADHQTEHEPNTSRTHNAGIGLVTEDEHNGLSGSVIRDECSGGECLVESGLASEQDISETTQDTDSHIDEQKCDKGEVSDQGDVAENAFEKEKKQKKDYNIYITSEAGDRDLICKTYKTPCVPFSESEFTPENGTESDMLERVKVADENIRASIIYEYYKSLLRGGKSAASITNIHKLLTGQHASAKNTVYSYNDLLISVKMYHVSVKGKGASAIRTPMEFFGARAYFKRFVPWEDVPPDPQEDSVREAAIRVYEHYSRLLKPSERKDNCIKSVEGLMSVKNGLTEEVLKSCADKYRNSRKSLDKTYFYDAANFYGRAGYYKSYLGTKPEERRNSDEGNVIEVDINDLNM